MIKLIIIIAVLMVILVVWHLRNLAIKDFQRNAGIDDLCYFYDNGRCIEGEIVASGVNDVVIDSDFGTHKRLRCDIYPL